MRNPFFVFLFIGVLLTAVVARAFADDAKNEAIKKDRKLIEGTWRVVALDVDDNKSMEEDARKITVVNGSDGTWSLRSVRSETSAASIQETGVGRISRRALAPVLAAETGR